MSVLMSLFWNMVMLRCWQCADHSTTRHWSGFRVIWGPLSHLLGAIIKNHAPCSLRKIFPNLPKRAIIMMLEIILINHFGCWNQTYVHYHINSTQFPFLLPSAAFKEAKKLNSELFWHGSMDSGLKLFALIKYHFVRLFVQNVNRPIVLQSLWQAYQFSTKIDSLFNIVQNCTWILM